MELLEFLNKTDNKNLICTIDDLVKQRLIEREVELKQRRQRLGEKFAFENSQFEQELHFLMSERVKEAASKRVEGIKMHVMERKRKEEEFLEMKKMQRALENSEEWRHLQSKEFLLESKRAQLYQIQEKMDLRCKENEVASFWLVAAERLNIEKDRQIEFEQKLRKLVEGLNQDANLRDDIKMKALHKEAEKQLLREFKKEDTDADLVAQKYCEEEIKRERLKQLQQAENLRDQIQHQYLNIKFQRASELAEGIKVKELEDRTVVEALNQKLGRRIRNREWQKSYLEHVLNEKKEQREKEKELEDVLRGSECVLQQKKKQPYGKEAR